MNIIQFEHKHKKHNSSWLQIPDHPYIILIVGGSGSGKKMHCLI